MNTMTNIKIGFYSSINEKTPIEFDFDMINTVVKTSSDYIRGILDDVQLLKSQNKLEEADERKRQLPAFTFSAFSCGGSKSNVVKHYNQIVVLNFNNIPIDLFTSVETQMRRDPYTLMMFTSPSGNGLKVFVKVNTELEFHKTAFRQVANYYKKITGIKPDNYGSNPLHFCFISFDPGVSYNVDSAVYCVDTEAEQRKQNKEELWRLKLGIHPKLLHYILEETTKVESYVRGNRKKFINQLAINLMRGGISREVAFTFSVEEFLDLTVNEIKSIVNEVYNGYSTDYNTVDYEVQMLMRPKENLNNSSTPIIPDNVFDTLPDFFRNQCSLFTDKRERDILLLSMLGIVSGCLNKVCGTYRGKKVYANLYFYIVAPSASNKGVMDFARMMGLEHHKCLINQSERAVEEYRIELEQCNIERKNGNFVNLPKRPASRNFYIPGNSSASVLLRQLKENGGTGVICESEGDTIGNMFKQDWGNFSEILRKAFHHEYISVSRRDEKNSHEIDNPRLSLIVTSTQDQVVSIVKSAENGLFSRIGFYLHGTKVKWVDMDLDDDEYDLCDRFSELGKVLKELIAVCSKEEVKFNLTQNQKVWLNEFGNRRMLEVAAFVDDEATSVVKRFGLIMFRLCMIFTAVRNFENRKPLNSELVCSDEDAKNALQITETLIEHSMAMFKILPKNGNSKINEQMRIFYDLLPFEFSRKRSLATGDRLGLKTPTVDKYLARLSKFGYLVQHKYGCYEKQTV